tara:strand:- start:167 stop:487 length:321 start_codon:yes stop_codon:yes gene_type:complete
MAKSLDDYKAEVTAEVESQKPMMILNSDGSEKEMTESDYEWHIDVTAKGRYELEQFGYMDQRVAEYGSIGDQLDMIYKDIDGGKLNKNGSWYKFIKKVKEDNPKPE